MMDNPLRILVISDLHAQGGVPGVGASYYSTSALYQTKENNPLVGICSLLKAEGLETDWLVCPGDIGDRADPAAQAAAWAKLDEIKKELGASQLIASAGNHDLDSRRINKDINPRDVLLSLDPPFPLLTEGSDKLLDADRYWSRNYVRTEFPRWNTTLFNLNSSAFHGYASEADKAPDEHNRGKISRMTLESVKSSLMFLPSKINIFLTHHHVKKSPFIEDGNSVMVGGDLLLDALKCSGRQWLLIHGHLHVPTLTYADADPFTPVILSSASVAAKTWPVRGKHPRNQIHHIEINPAINNEAQQILGVITSFTWSYEVGWQKSSGEELIPYRSGFGYRPNTFEAATTLVDLVKATNGPMKWQTVLEACPKFRFMTPKDLEGVLASARLKGLEVEPGAYGLPTVLE